MPSARDIMTGSAECASVNDSLVDAARKMRDLDVGSLPICGDDNRLKGMVTDRDIVIKCVADGGNPGSVKLSELAEGKPVTIGADDAVEDVLRTMTEHGVRRLPVITAMTSSASSVRPMSRRICPMTRSETWSRPSPRSPRTVKPVQHRLPEVRRRPAPGVPPGSQRLGTGWARTAPSYLPLQHRRVRRQSRSRQGDTLSIAIETLVAVGQALALPRTTGNGAWSVASPSSRNCLTDQRAKDD
jgi:CBS domain-containing protein